MSIPFRIFCAFLAVNLFVPSVGARNPAASLHLTAQGFAENGAFEIHADRTGQAGIIVESSTDLINWDYAWLISAGAEPPIFSDPGPPQPRKFFRARLYMLQVEGTVRDIEAGTPIAGATVRLSFQTTQHGADVVTQTDAEGDFQLAALPLNSSGLVDIQVEKQGYEPLTIYRSYAPYLAQLPEDLELAPPGYRPPNDDFATRTVLEGTNLTVEANTFAATSEPGHTLTIAYEDILEIHPLDRWWTWTAPVDGAVGIDLDETRIYAGLVVYTGNSLDELVRVWDSAQGDAGFFVSAGTQYQIAAGSYAPDQTGFTLRMIEPVAPAITVQPYPGTPLTGIESGIYAVGEPITLWFEAEGTAPLSYQWFKDGIEIPDATNQVRSWEQASLEDSGDYSVKVTNQAGSIVSAEVTITVLPE